MVDLSDFLKLDLTQLSRGMLAINAFVVFGLVVQLDLNIPTASFLEKLALSLLISAPIYTLSYILSFAFSKRLGIADKDVHLSAIAGQSVLSIVVTLTYLVSRYVPQNYYGAYLIAALLIPIILTFFITQLVFGLKKRIDSTRISNNSQIRKKKFATYFSASSKLSERSFQERLIYLAGILGIVGSLLGVLVSPYLRSVNQGADIRVTQICPDDTEKEIDRLNFDLAVILSNRGNAGGAVIFSYGGVSDPDGRLNPQIGLTDIYKTVQRTVYLMPNDVKIFNTSISRIFLSDYGGNAIVLKLKGYQNGEVYEVSLPWKIDKTEKWLSCAKSPGEVIVDKPISEGQRIF